MLKRSPDERVQRAALEALAACGDDVSVDAILAVACSEGPLARSADRALIRLARGDGMEVVLGRWSKLSSMARRTVLQAGVRADEVPDAMLTVAAQALCGESPGTRNGSPPS